jgi:hypothetical protein
VRIQKRNERRPIRNELPTGKLLEMSRTYASELFQASGKGWDIDTLTPIIYWLGLFTGQEGGPLCLCTKRILPD